MKMRKAFGGLILLLVTSMIMPLYGQLQRAEPRDETIDSKTQAEIIDSVTRVINEVYVFPDVAEEMAVHVKGMYQKGEYKDITSLSAFSDRLTKDLRDICHDRHLGVRYTPDITMDDIRTEEDTVTDEERQEHFEELSRDNFGFKEIRILPGNIGYLKFNGFVDAYFGGATAIAAMNFLAHVDALIIDLRENGGGSPSMIQLISSYFFNDPVHLNSFYIRKEDTTKQFWTASHVEGPRMANTPIYILTSGYTFSAAEEFTYNLKNLERATIVGETTGGGAHPVQGEIFPNLKVSLRVPFGRAINPITGTNWEGTGVEPHISCAADHALEVARVDAMEKLVAKAESEEEKGMLRWDLDMLKAQLEPVEVPEELMNKYVGDYGPRKIWMEGDELYYQRDDRPKQKLIALSEDIFMIEGVDYFKMKFEEDESGEVIGILGIYKQGFIDRSPKDK
ncbi:MAG TPA: hypothetical protein ENO22_13640 [candidate division Zixibacteria bacterium]|nr:hypothetical protein [candidate division Zixibacteria bacterium]HER00378.1 hypothetical protein [candidate division Zixibacteria bacterium]